MSKAKRFAFAGIAGLLLSLLAPLGAQATEGHPGPLVQEEVATAGPTSVAKTHSNESAARSIAERVLASDDPAAYFASLRPTEQSIFKAYVMVDHTVTNFEYRPANTAANASAKKGIVPNRTYSPQATGCWVAVATVDGLNAFGAVMWRVQLNGGWCASGSAVYSAWLDGSWGQTYGLGWTHEGRIGSGSGVVSNQGRTWVQHKFTWGTGGWIIQTQTPCARVKGLGSGSAASDTVCGLY